VVLELSSFQLQSLGKSPHIAVVLNITSDHMDYHLSRDEYIGAKTEIFRHQTRDDYAVLNADDETVKRLSLKIVSRKRWFSQKMMSDPGAFCLNGRLFLNLDGQEEEICAASEIKIPGEHNISNILAASVAAALAGASISAVRAAVKDYRGLPNHRLETAGTRRGVVFINDSAATMPEATIAALAAFPKPKILIAGGSDKGADYKFLSEAIKAQNVKAVFLLGQTGKSIADGLRAAGFLGEVGTCESLEEAVKKSYEKAAPGDVVLLSPASASFGLFHDYQERGDRFKKIVASLPD
jgi:UDP-N-acetylmuramoylalanine--D-glutamate ligase